jgi:hypothetical protein
MSRAWCGSAAGIVHSVARRYGVAGALVLALAAAGCSSTWQAPDTVVDLRGATIAIESIEGAPPGVVHSFARDLNEEATARRIAVVAQGMRAQYRVRGYLAPQAGGGGLAWAWDIYDAGQKRAFRLRGEENAGPRAWADAQALRRIAQASIAQFAAFLAANRTPPIPGPGTPQPSSGPAVVAEHDDFRPEAAGIFRVLAGGPAVPAPDAGTETVPQGFPLPPRRPAGAATPAALAFNRPER